MSVPPRTKKRKRSTKTIRKSCDVLWSKLVRKVGFCERCGRTEGVLHAHHIYSRRDYRLRFELRNGVCLCYRCHRFAEGFPIDFASWLTTHRAFDLDFLREERQKGPIRRTTRDYVLLEEALKAQLG